MGQLVDGQWQEQPLLKSGGAYKRVNSPFRGQINADGQHTPEAGRYHLYVSTACPWCHRVMIQLRLKGLTGLISMSEVTPLMGPSGWMFDESHSDPLFGASTLHEVYTRANSHYTGRVTVPILWDRHHQTIVSNESSEILRMLNTAFDDLGADPTVDWYPKVHRSTIDRWNGLIYNHINNGVYKCGFAGSQKAYDAAITALFAQLDLLEQHLSEHSTLVGDQLTEADWRLWVTLARFDAVYHVHFKCTLRRLRDYSALWNYARRLYAIDGVAETARFEDIRLHYYGSHPMINPRGILPRGPEIDWSL